MVTRRVTAALVAAVAILACPATAGAHATVEGTSPTRGATVVRQPDQVVFRFSGPVEGSFGAVRVFDADGRRVDAGDAFHPAGDGAQLAVRLRPRLPRGTYTATYRVVSADSHVVSGGLVFSVGRATGAGQTVEELLGRSGTGPVTSVAFAVARATQYAAIALALGGLLFAVGVWAGAVRGRGREPDGWAGATAAFAARARTLLLGAVAAGASSALAAVVLEAAQGAGVGAWSALRPRILREVLDTRFGTTWSIAAACWVVLGAAGVALLGPGRRLAWWALAPPAAYLALLPALSGHGATQGPVALMFGANVLHVVAMSAWAGGLLTLLVAVAAATRRLGATERTPLLSAVLERFSALALAAVGLLLVTGLVQAYVEIRSLDLVGSAFGRAVLVKLALLTGLIVLGALNRRRTLPRLRAAAHARRAPGRDGRLLRRVLGAELGLIAAALATTGALAGYAPPVDAAAGPYAATTRIGPQELQLVIDPALTGANQLHVYLTDPRTGAQLDDAKEVTVSARLPSRRIGAISQRASKAGPGHYVVPDLALGVRGTWEVTLIVRVSDFDEYARRLEVPVR